MPAMEPVGVQSLGMRVERVAEDIDQTVDISTDSDVAFALDTQAPQDRAADGGQIQLFALYCSSGNSLVRPDLPCDVGLFIDPDGLEEADDFPLFSSGNGKGRLKTVRFECEVRPFPFGPDVFSCHGPRKY